MILKYKDKFPDVHPTAYIASTGIVAGDVRVKEFASIFFGASARGDINYISIGSYTNIQDNATLHVTLTEPCIIGNSCVIGHNAVLHGCTVEDFVLAGISSVVLNRAVVGKYSIIASGALVTEGSVIPEYSMVMGSPAKVVRQVNEKEITMIEDIVKRYVNVMQEYKSREL